MVMDKAGNPLLTVAERRDELVRCTQIIGWSWQKLADRFEITLAGAYQIKNCKVGIVDSDLRWLQEVAAMLESMPRPAVANDTTPELTRLGAPAQMPGVEDAIAAKMMADAQVDAAVEAERDRMARTLADVYLAADSEVSGESRAAARWAIGEVAMKVGLLPQVQAMLRRVPVLVDEPADVQPRRQREPFPVDMAV